MPVRLTKFQMSLPIVDARGKPTPAFLDALNRFVKETETAINLQPTIEAAAAAANTAAAAANEAVEQIQSGTLTIEAIKNPDGSRAIWDGSAYVAEP